MGLVNACFVTVSLIGTATFVLFSQARNRVPPAMARDARACEKVSLSGRQESRHSA
jgi:hypothetical protein